MRRRASQVARSGVHRCHEQAEQKRLAGLHAACATATRSAASTAEQLPWQYVHGRARQHGRHERPRGMPRRPPPNAGRTHRAPAPEDALERGGRWARRTTTSIDATGRQAARRLRRRSPAAKPASTTWEPTRTSRATARRGAHLEDALTANTAPRPQARAAGAPPC